jgi:hypothetical protein
MVYVALFPDQNKMVIKKNQWKKGRHIQDIQAN